METLTSFHIATRKFYNPEHSRDAAGHLTDAESITVDPLREPVKQIFQHAGGFTIGEFCAAVADGYERIYREEEESRTKSVELHPEESLLLNRAKTDGVHGIWGHDLDDLVIEIIHAPKTKNGIWTISVGS
jgi:hypothetical protein